MYHYGIRILYLVLKSYIITSYALYNAVLSHANVKIHLKSDNSTKCPKEIFKKCPFSQQMYTNIKCKHLLNMKHEKRTCSTFDIIHNTTSWFVWHKELFQSYLIKYQNYLTFYKSKLKWLHVIVTIGAHTVCNTMFILQLSQIF